MCSLYSNSLKNSFYNKRKRRIITRSNSCEIRVVWIKALETPRCNLYNSKRYQEDNPISKIILAQRCLIDKVKTCVAEVT